MVPEYTVVYSNDGEDTFSRNHEADLHLVRLRYKEGKLSYSKLEAVTIPGVYKDTPMGDLVRRSVTPYTFSETPLVRYHPGDYAPSGDPVKELR
jgi:hypothetical protein